MFGNGMKYGVPCTNVDVDLRRIAMKESIQQYVLTILSVTDHVNPVGFDLRMVKKVFRNSISDRAPIASH
jgi:hypothetical protein